MDDLTMLKLCARASELKVFVDAYGALCLEQLDILSADNVAYDPLHDDAQCFALVKRFRLSLHTHDQLWCANDKPNFTENTARDADINRAVVSCVALMQQSKEKG